MTGADRREGRLLPDVRVPLQTRALAGLLIGQPG